VTTEKKIILNTKINPKMIASVRISFITTTELNVGRMSKQIIELQGKLYASDKRTTRQKKTRKGSRKRVKPYT